MIASIIAVAIVEVVGLIISIFQGTNRQPINHFSVRVIYAVFRMSSRDGLIAVINFFFLNKSPTKGLGQFQAFYTKNVH